MSEPHEGEVPERRSDDESGLPPQIAEVFRNLTGGAPIPPEMVEMLRNSGIADLDPQMLSMMAQQVQTMFSRGPSEDPVDLEVARDVARKVTAASADPVPSARDQEEAHDSVTVAGLWLDAVTSVAGGSQRGRAWSRAQWVEASMPVWGDLVAPVAQGVADAVGAAMAAQLADLGDVEIPGVGRLPEGALSEMQPILRRLHGSLFSLQLGQGVGSLAGEVLTGCEIGLPLIAGPDVVLLAESVRELAAGLEIDAPQVWLYLAVRESARTRLFADNRWIAEDLLAAVRDYAADITIDTAGIEQAISSIDVQNPAAVQEALQGQLFTAEPSVAQRRALARLETSLALVEGWVDHVTAQATAAHLPQSAALGEAVRRRRATGGPAERTFAALVGLELRPRRLRDAANLFAALEARGGPELRDGAWEHPDLAPTSADLDDPLGYVERRAAPAGDDLDAELDALLHRVQDEGDGPDPERP